MKTKYLRFVSEFFSKGFCLSASVSIVDVAHFEYCRHEHVYIYSIGMDVEERKHAVRGIAKHSQRRRRGKFLLLRNKAHGVEEESYVHSANDTVHNVNATVHNVNVTVRSVNVTFRRNKNNFVLPLKKLFFGLRPIFCCGMPKWAFIGGLCVFGRFLRKNARA